MVKFSRKKNVNVFRVVSKIVGALIALWAGGTIVTELGNVMHNTSSPFYTGLSLIGWTVEASTACPTAASNSCITSTDGTGILAVVGIIAVATIILEFVDISL